MKLKSTFLFILIFFVNSCGSSEKNLNKEVSKKTFSSPFQGTIEAEEIIGNAILKKKIKYTVSKNFIKRESVLNNILIKDVVNGIICDLNLNEIILYRINGEKKFYVKLKVEEYLILREALLASSPLVNRVLENFPFGTIFADLPQKGVYSIVKDEHEINNYFCKESEIKYLNIHLVIDHCEGIQVDKKLLELVEVGYPERINGLGINVTKKYSEFENKDSLVDMDNLDKIFNKAEKVYTKIKSFLNFKFAIKEIVEKVIDKTEFSLGVDFLEVKTFGEMISSTGNEKSGKTDWD